MTTLTARAIIRPNGTLVIEKLPFNDGELVDVQMTVTAAPTVESD